MSNYVDVQAADTPMANGSLTGGDEALIRLPALGKPPRTRAVSEESRIARAQSGDREAFDALLQAHEPEIRKFVSKRVGREYLDDLLQEIWLAAWSCLAEFDRRSRFRTWLYGIAINKCKGLYRAQNRRTAHLALEDLVPERARPEAPASDLEARLSALLTELSPQHRQLLDLYYYGELTLPEIASLLDRNLNTVKYQFYRAHATISKLLKEARK